MIVEGRPRPAHDPGRTCVSCLGCGYRLADCHVEEGRTVHPFCEPGMEWRPDPFRRVPAASPRTLSNGPGYPVGRNHPPHAREAARRASGARYDVLEALRSHGPLSDFDLEDRIGRTHQSTSGARRALVISGHVRDTGRTTVNRYGNTVTLWEAVPGRG